MLNHIINRITDTFNKLGKVQEVTKRLCNLCEKAAKSPDQLKVGVYGLLNSGKSTLLNVLTGHFDKEFFPTGDLRTTISNRVFQTVDHYYIDTPGLDSDKADDFLANESLFRTEVVLFVHNAASELESYELKVLTKLSKMLGKFAQQGIILVLSRKDSLLDEELQTVQSKIAQQCSEVLGFEIKMVSVSSLLYKKAMAESDAKRKAGFISLSNIPQLQDMLKRSSAINPAYLEQQKLLNKLQHINTCLSNVEKQVRLDQSMLKQNVSKSFAATVKAANSFENELTSERHNFNNKYQELNQVYEELMRLINQNK